VNYKPIQKETKGNTKPLPKENSLMIEKRKSSLVVGHTTDDIPEIVLGIESGSITLSLDDAAKLSTQLKNLVRRLRRSSWKHMTGDNDD
jgi:hypothetical protein